MILIGILIEWEIAMEIRANSFWLIRWNSIKIQWHNYDIGVVIRMAWKMTVMSWKMTCKSYLSIWQVYLVDINHRGSIPIIENPFISNKSSQRKKGMAYSFYRNHILKIIFFFLIYPAKKEGTPLDRYETEKKSNSRCMRKSTCSKFEEIIWWWTCDNERNTAHMYKKVISETTGLFFDISCWCEEDRSMKYCCSRDDHITKEDQRIHSCWQSQDF